MFMFVMTLFRFFVDAENEDLKKQLKEMNETNRIAKLLDSLEKSSEELESKTKSLNASRHAAQIMC